MNRRGQALIEAIIFSVIAILCTSKMIQVGLDLRYQIVFDDLIERTLICHFQKQTNCVSILREKLTALHFSDIQITEVSDKKTTQLKLSVKTRLNTVISRKSELSLDLSL